MTDPFVLSVPLGGLPLAELAQGSAPPPWYALAPRTSQAWRAHADQVRHAAPPGWLDALASALPAEGPAAERLRRAAAGGFVVTTGQQPGLFGGPIYTFSKAVSALALADVLQALCGVPVAPVFWAATDDSDFAEAAATYVAGEGGVRILRLPEPERPDLPLCDVPLPSTERLLNEMRAATGAAVSPEALELLARCYAEGQTVGDAYVALLRQLLGPLGIAVLDAGHGAVVAAARPLLLQALERSEAIDAALAARESLLRNAGHEPQVARVPGLSLVFTRAAGGRVRLPIGASRAAATEAHPVLSANVLLRPVVERTILPTACYVAGPGELAYFAQVGAVAEVLDADRPVAVPRWSGLIIEPHIRRLLDRHALEPDDLLDAHAAESRLARGTLDPAVSQQLDALRDAVAAGIAALRRAVPPDDAQLPETVLQGAQRDLQRRVDRLERRIVAAAKRRETTLMRDLATLRAALRPFGRPQERVLNFMPLLARHGPALLASMHARAHEHAVRITTVAAPPSTTTTPAEHGRLSGAHGRT